MIKNFIEKESLSAASKYCVILYTFNFVEWMPIFLAIPCFYLCFMHCYICFQLQVCTKTLDLCLCYFVLFAIPENEFTKYDF